MSDGIRKKECFVALFDILGFSDLIRDEGLEKVTNTYTQAKAYFEENHEHLTACSPRNDAVSFHIFSDTFLLHTGDVTDLSFHALLAACDFLFMATNENSLPIRGAITVGELSVAAGLELGQPIVDACKNEQRQDWIGCWVDGPCFDQVDKAEYLSNKSIVEYEIPLKDGEVKKRYAFNWVQSIANIVKSRRGENDFTPEEIRAEIKFISDKNLPWAGKRKHDNTRKFVDFVLTPEFLKEYKY